MKIENVPIEKIKPMEKFSPHPNDVKGLHSLANSMRFYGMKLPILIRETGEDYRLIDGNKRLCVWQYLNLGKEIPCIVIEAHAKMQLECLLPFMTSESKNLKENQQDVLDIYAMIAINLVRTKVDKSVLEDIVRYLHEELGLGYGSIAQRIGYSKAGVQKMLNRMDEKKLSSDGTTFPPGHSLKRLRTELDRLEESIPTTMNEAEEVTEAIHRVHEYINLLLNGA